MRNVILMDSRINFLQSVQMRVAVNGPGDVNITDAMTDSSGLVKYAPGSVDEVIVADNMIDAEPDWDILGFRITTYATSGAGLAMTQGRPCYGVFGMQDGGKLLDALNAGPPAPTQAARQNRNGMEDMAMEGTETPRGEQAMEYQAQGGEPQGQYGQDTNTYPPQYPQGQYYGQDPNAYPPQYPQGQYYGQDTNTYPPQYPQGQYYGQDTNTYPPQYPQGQYGQDGYPYAQDGGYPQGQQGYGTDYGQGVPQEQYGAYGQQGQDPNAYPPQYPQGQYYGQDPNAYPPQYPQYGQDGYPYAQGNGQPSALDQHYAYQQQQAQAMGEDLERRLAPKQQQTKIISLFAAKGGVGKTTIATSLALRLSMLSEGPNRLRVALVDYDVDFGDVGIMLALPVEDVCMDQWGEVIRGRMKNEINMSGAQTEAEIEAVMERVKDSMTFTQDEINDYLRDYSQTGLKVLVGPINHQSSMKFDGYEFSIMLRNLRDSGMFDYIVCDTGNNTRDASFSAVQVSDTIYMVNTQEITTVNCNDSVLNAFKQSNFDMSRFKCVINKVRPVSETGIDVSEIETIMNGQNHECVTRLDLVTEVTKDNNKGEPTVIAHPNSDFTKELEYLVMDILGKKMENVENAGRKKKPLFGWKK